MLDYRANPGCDTGRFELAFKDTAQQSGPHGDVRLLVEGKAVKRGDLQRYTQLDAKNTKREAAKQRKEGKVRTLTSSGSGSRSSATPSSAVPVSAVAAAEGTGDNQQDGGEGEGHATTGDNEKTVDNVNNTEKTANSRTPQLATGS